MSRIKLELNQETRKTPVFAKLQYFCLSKTYLMKVFELFCENESRVIISEILLVSNTYPEVQ